jgi:hypothetical protein
MHVDFLEKIWKIHRTTSKSLKLLQRSVWQLLYISSSRSNTPVFVVGCQRSGTTMLLNVLERSPLCRVYHEGDETVFSNYHLKEDAAIQKQVCKSLQQIVVFKPLNDLQHTDLLLETFPNAKAIWIFR